MTSAIGSYQGLILGNTYKVGRLLGHGGMGRVHMATHLRLPVRFAVKFLEPRLARDALSYERFRREAEIASSLGNPHIAHVLDFNTLPDGSPYMILELLEGEDLASRLAWGSLSADEVVRLSEHLASALTEAHERGVVHRDIKPENIFLCRCGEGEPFVAKVLDFGISKLRRKLDRDTANGALLGTPAYMSPEQAGGATHLVDHRSDIYSMAAVLYEALCGRRAHPGDNAYEILTQIATCEPPELPGWPPEVNAVLQRGLARHPADRHPSAQALHRDLVHALTGRYTAALAMRPPTGKLAATGVDPVARTDVAFDTLGPRSLLAAGFARVRRSGRVGLGLVALAVMVAVGLALAPGAPDATASGQPRVIPEAGHAATAEPRADIPAPPPKPAAEPKRARHRQRSTPPAARAPATRRPRTAETTPPLPRRSRPGAPAQLLFDSREL